MRFALIVLLLVVCAACVRTKLTTYRDPAYASGYRLGKVLVAAQGLPLAERSAVESSFVIQFQTANVIAVRSLDLIPPTRQFTPEAVQSIIESNAINSVLLMTDYAKGTDTAYVPQTHVPGQSTSTVTFYGNMAYVNTQTTPGYTYGGFNVRKPRYSYSLNLFDTANGRVVWTASGDARGSAASGVEDFGHSTAASTLTKMIEEGLLPRPSGSAPTTGSASGTGAGNNRCLLDPHFC